MEPDTWPLTPSLWDMISSHWDLHTETWHWTHTELTLLARWHCWRVTVYLFHFLIRNSEGALHIPNIVSMYTSSFIHLSFLFFYLTETVPGGASLPYGSVSICCAVCKALHGIGFTVTTNPPKCAIFKTITKRVFNASSGHLSASLPAIPDGVCHLLNGITGNTTLVG